MAEQSPPFLLCGLGFLFCFCILFCTHFGWVRKVFTPPQILGKPSRILLARIFIRSCTPQNQGVRSGLREEGRISIPGSVSGRRPARPRRQSQSLTGGPAELRKGQLTRVPLASRAFRSHATERQTSRMPVAWGLGARIYCGDSCQEMRWNTSFLKL